MIKPFAIVGAAALSLAGGVAAWLWLVPPAVDLQTPYAAPGIEAMGLEQATAEAYKLAPALLMEVYGAFGETEEAAIYDRLAQVAAGPALEALYLERAGAMAGGGLTKSDQTIHEMRLLWLDTRREGAVLRMDAQWLVIGRVGHSEHEHVRGNAYSAVLEVAPVEGAWRIQGFDLRDVDRSLAGTRSPGEASTW